jgi:hypothetical protein
MTFADYQSLAFLTARTKDRTLVEVCLAVLWQLSAQLFRRKLPSIELRLNKALADRSTNDVLGEIAWHVAALASIYGLDLGEIAENNQKKVRYRRDRKHPTPLHDEHLPETEQLPRRFEVVVVTIGEGRSRMYLGGRRLGDDLTDNSHAEDGYRFHDVMHLANAAKLGWSPVLRGLMGRKRKSVPALDEVEDGARAKIVEEAVIKAIHSEGERLLALRGAGAEGPERLFPSSGEITFRFLKFVQNLVAGLEVEANRYWEWEEAILAGYDIFYRLRCEGQGTISVDLEARSITFKSEVHLPLAGAMAGLGSAHLKLASDGPADTPGVEPSRERLVQKLAILSSLGLSNPTAEDLRELEVGPTTDDCANVRAAGHIRGRMWSRGIITFRTTVVETESGWYCTAVAVSDP